MGLFWFLNDNKINPSFMAFSYLLGSYRLDFSLLTFYRKSKNVSVNSTAETEPLRLLLLSLIPLVGLVVVRLFTCRQMITKEYAVNAKFIEKINRVATKYWPQSIPPMK